MSTSIRDTTMMVSHTQRKQIMAELAASVEKVNALITKLEGQAAQIIMVTENKLEEITDRYIRIMEANKKAVQDTILEGQKIERAGAVVSGLTAIIVYGIAYSFVGPIGAFVPATISMKPGEVLGVTNYRKFYRFYNWLENSKLGSGCSKFWNSCSNSKLGLRCARAWDYCFGAEPSSKEVSRETIKSDINQASLIHPEVFNAISDVLDTQPELLRAIFATLRQRSVKILEANDGEKSPAANSVQPLPKHKSKEGEENTRAAAANGSAYVAANTYSPNSATAAGAGTGAYVSVPIPHSPNSYADPIKTRSDQPIGSGEVFVDIPSASPTPATRPVDTGISITPAAAAAAAESGKTNVAQPLQPLNRTVRSQTLSGVSSARGAVRPLTAASRGRSPSPANTGRPSSANPATPKQLTQHLSAAATVTSAVATPRRSPSPSPSAGNSPVTINISSLPLAPAPLLLSVASGSNTSATGNSGSAAANGGAATSKRVKPVVNGASAASKKR